jgi:hypothetical protein
MDALSCSFESLPLILPPPILPDYVADSWHPEDYTKPSEWPFFAAGPTRSYVEWLAFDKENTPAGDASEETWASLVDAYRHLPHKLAVESVILAHVPYVHKMVYKWMRTVLGLDAERKELRGRQLVLMERAGVKTKKKGGGATIAEDLFSVGLLTLVETAPRLREVGRRENWDDWDAPGHMAHYLGVAASNAIWDCFEAEKVDREHVLAYLKKFHVGSALSLLPPARKPLDGDTVPIDDDKGYQFTPMKALSWPVGGQSDTTPQLDRAVSAQPDDAQETAHQRQGRYLPYHKLTPAAIAERNELLNRACRDVKDRLLLTMRREGVATETEMGEWVDLRRSQVNRRLHRLQETLEKAFDLRSLPACKRASRLDADSAVQTGASDDDSSYKWIRAPEDTPVIKGERKLPFYRRVLPFFRVPLDDLFDDNGTAAR